VSLPSLAVDFLDRAVFLDDGQEVIDSLTLGVEQQRIDLVQSILGDCQLGSEVVVHSVPPYTFCVLFL
jgi:hypothetical protein